MDAVPPDLPPDLARIAVTHLEMKIELMDARNVEGVNVKVRCSCKHRGIVAELKAGVISFMDHDMREIPYTAGPRWGLENALPTCRVCHAQYRFADVANLAMQARRRGQATTSLRASLVI